MNTKGINNRLIQLEVKGEKSLRRLIEHLMCDFKRFEREKHLPDSESSLRLRAELRRSDTDQI